MSTFMKYKVYVLLFIMLLSGCATESPVPQFVSVPDTSIYEIDQKLSVYHKRKKHKHDRSKKTSLHAKDQNLSFESKKYRLFDKDTVAASEEFKTSQGYFLRKK